MIYILFRIRTDTSKDRPGFFIGAFDKFQTAIDKAVELNKELEDDSIYRYTVDQVELNNPEEGGRLWRERGGY